MNDVRNSTSRLLDWAETTGDWEHVARLCLEWLAESDVRDMVEHYAGSDLPSGLGGSND